MYEKPSVNLSEVQLLRLRGTFRTLPLIYARNMYTSKNYATVEIHLYWPYTESKNECILSGTTRLQNER